MKSLESMIGNIRKGIDERQAQTETDLKHRENNNLVKLPLWGKTQRGVPNCILRGSLFSARQEKDTQYIDEELHTSGEDIVLKFRGVRLIQQDLDVWESLLHIMRQGHLGEKIHISEYGLLKILGKVTKTQRKNGQIQKNASQEAHNSLRETLKKLQNGTVEITHNGKTYMGSLINEIYRDDTTREMEISINPRMGRLFDAGNTWVSWEERSRIGARRPLALWLHGYISSHAKWYPHKIETIRKLSGSKTEDIHKFTQSLKKALGVLKKEEIILDYKIDSKKLLCIERIPTDSQKGHLKRKEKAE